MNRKNFIAFLALAMFALVGNAAGNQAALQVDGILPALRVEGKNLVDANGKIVVLHGVMDTPNRYFNGWRWQQWKADYSESDIQPCLEYFSKQFSAITDKEQGAYCTVFRCTWIHAGPTIQRRRQRTRLTSRHSAWRAIASISRNSISH